MHAQHEPRGSALDGEIMSRSVAFALLCLLVVAVCGSEGVNRVERGTTKGHTQWSYDEATTGPEHWPSMYRDCNGSMQSPVDIKTADLDPDTDLDEIDFDNYDDDLDDAVMENNGHTVVVTPGAKDPTLKISDGGLDDTYELQNIHFHWGSVSEKGSEHTIDGKRYPLEMHLVHKNEKYKTMEAALNKEDGLAVLGVLFELDDEDNDDLDPIIDNLAKILTENQKVDLDDLSVEKLLPDNLMPYYRYDGSLTTPKCDEVVTWTIFKDLVPISEKQLKEFRKLKEKEEGETKDEPLVNNFRKTQPLNKRVIHISVESGNSHSDNNDNSAQNIHLSASMIIGLAALSTVLTFCIRV